MITTIVLIQAEPRLIPKTAVALAGIDGVTDVYSVSGEWDLIAIVKVKEYEEIAVNKLDGATTRASIVPSDGELFIRTYKHLWCVTQKK